jgi:antitoxin component YwqK of YwqJK toxin-antitoxin module
MKFLFLILAITLSTFVSIAQTFQENQYYVNGELMKQSVYDSTTQYWKTTEYYRGGRIASEKVAFKNKVNFTDTLKTYYTNGNTVYKASFNNGYLDGKYFQYYESGKLKKTGNFYKFFKTGTWTEYYENGQKKTEGVYILTKADSIEKNPTTLSNRTQMDTIVYRDVISIDSVENYKSGKVAYDIYVDSTQTRKDMLLTIPTNKNGIWSSWDNKGNLLLEEKYVNGILQKNKR